MSKLPTLKKGLSNNIKEEVLIARETVGVEYLKKIIRDMGLKVTVQRLAILKALNQGKAHRTAQEVFEVVIKALPDIGFATVYRFLRDLSEAGYVTELRMGKRGTCYELKTSTHHDHITCTHCGKIVEFFNADLERLQELIAFNNGFILTSHELELFGICADCK
jgi:Fur family ferric uptake transcriptional regulator